MKLISKRVEEKYTEIVLEKRFLFWSYRTTYRLCSGNVFEYKKNNEYITIGLYSSACVYPYFCL